MKIKPKTKKIIVLSVMVLLLVATGVLNFVLSDKLNKTTDNVNADQGTVTQTFFAAAKSDRDSTRESEFLYLDAIMQSESSTESAKKSAQEQNSRSSAVWKKNLHSKRLSRQEDLRTQS